MASKSAVNKNDVPPRRSPRMSQTSYLQAIGSLGAFAGVLMIANGATNLSIRDANPDTKEMAICGKRSSDALEVVEGVLIMLAAFLLIMYANNAQKM